jgi:hypothetical protein
MLFKALEPRSFYSPQSSAQAYKANKQETKNNTPIKRKTLKERTKRYVRFYGYASARNIENGAKLESIVKSLTNNKRLRACSYFNEKSCGKNILEKYSMLPFNKLHLIKEITINLIIFYL